MKLTDKKIEQIINDENKIDKDDAPGQEDLAFLYGYRAGGRRNLHDRKLALAAYENIVNKLNKPSEG